VPQIPDFLWSLNFMRLSLMKAAHAVVSGAAHRKFGHLARFSRDVGYADLDPACLQGSGNICSTTALNGSVALPFVIPTGAYFPKRPKHKSCVRSIELLPGLSPMGQNRKVNAVAQIAPLQAFADLRYKKGGKSLRHITIVT
jgi:hypothetical protein